MNAIICILHKLPARCSAASQINTKCPDRGVKAFFAASTISQCKIQFNLNTPTTSNIKSIMQRQYALLNQTFIRDYYWFTGKCIMDGKVKLDYFNEWRCKYSINFNFYLFIKS